MNDPTIRAAILVLLDDLEQCWRTLDFERLRRLWDSTRDPVYQAEEAASPCLDWPALHRYWETTGRAIERMGMRITSDVTLHELAPGLVTAVYGMHWDALIRGDQKPVGGDNRVFASFRLTDAGWRFAQYVESPLAPIMYLKKLYQDSVTPGFLAPDSP